MKHRVSHNHFGRTTNQHKWLFRNLVAEIFEHGRIETTLAKAKAMRGVVDKVINIAKKDTVASKRQIVKEMGTDRLTNLLCQKIAPSLADRNSGYTRIYKLGPRLADATEMAIIELVSFGLVDNSKPVEKKETEVKSEKVEKKAKVEETEKIEESEEIKEAEIVEEKEEKEEKKEKTEKKKSVAKKPVAKKKAASKK